MVPTFKIVLIGDAGVGKTTFIECYSTGKFLEEYVPSTKVEVFKLNTPIACFEVWNVSSCDKSRAIVVGADAVIIMFDVTNVRTWDNLPSHLSSIASGVPIVVCGNKMDQRCRGVKTKVIAREKWGGFLTDIPYFGISCRSNYNHGMVFQHLAQKLLGLEKLPNL